MANSTLQRATWSLQILRQFHLSFPTAFPRNAMSRNLSEDARSKSRNILPRSAPRLGQTRSVYTSTKLSQDPEAKDMADYKDSSPTEVQSLTEGLYDSPLILDEGSRQVDWARSFHGLSTEAFPPEAAKILLAPLDPNDVEVKHDGIVYLPEIKYRRVLNNAFGPGAWGLAPRGETIVTPKSVTREYALVVLGRLVSIARGEQDYFSPEAITTAVEGCKSNAMMRCCKDLGVASELWDPRWIRSFLKEHVREVFVEHQPTKKRKKMWLRKDDVVKYPFKETKYGA